MGFVQTDDKRAKLLALKASVAASKISSQLQTMITQTSESLVNATQQQQQTQGSAEERERSLNLIIDSEGRTIDKRTGEVVQIQSRVPTLKANIKQSQKRDYKTVLGGGSGNDLFASGTASTISGVSSIYARGVAAAVATVQVPAPATEKEPSEEQFFDPRLRQKTANRDRRKLVFNEKGKYEDIANKMRTKTKLLMLQQEITSISKKTGISAESKLALIQPKRLTVFKCNLRKKLKSINFFK